MAILASTNVYLNRQRNDSKIDGGKAICWELATDQSDDSHLDGLLPRGLGCNACADPRLGQCLHARQSFSSRLRKFLDVYCLFHGQTDLVWFHWTRSTADIQKTKCILKDLASLLISNNSTCGLYQCVFATKLDRKQPVLEQEWLGPHLVRHSFGFLNSAF